jgi:hypothetical protein
VRNHISIRSKKETQRGGNAGFLAYGRGIALESRICSIAHLASVRHLIDAALAAHAHRLVSEVPLLLSIEACIERLGGSREKDQSFSYGVFLSRMKILSLDRPMYSAARRDEN